MHETNTTHTIAITVITNAQKESISEFGDRYKVKINAIPEKGKANESIIKLLAKRLKISQKNIKIIKGELSNKKTIVISKFAGSISEILD